MEGLLELLRESHYRIFIKQEHVSESGMMRTYLVYCVISDANGAPHIVNITSKVAEAIEAKLHRKSGGIIVRGCGFDGAHDIAFRLSRKLYDHTSVIEYMKL